MAAAPPPTYLDGVVVRLARLCVRPVRHEPGLQQVLVKAVPQSSHGRVICRDRRREDELPGAGGGGGALIPLTANPCLSCPILFTGRVPSQTAGIVCGPPRRRPSALFQTGEA